MNPGIELEKVLRYGRLTDDELEHVLGLNLARLIGLDPDDPAYQQQETVDYPIAETEWVKAEAMESAR
jgi:hypothetical protein